MPRVRINPGEMLLLLHIFSLMLLYSLSLSLCHSSLRIVFLSCSDDDIIKFLLFSSCDTNILCLPL